MYLNKHNIIRCFSQYKNKNKLFFPNTESFNNHDKKKYKCYNK